jgi:DNA mismatch repair protein MutS
MPGDDENLTPVMRQYRSVKARYADAIIFFRLGDFYEMFFEDAETGSTLLGLTLTGRNKGGGERAPMCGVPHHSAARYIRRLLAAGHKVAVCEQVEDPATAKGLVKRDVVRLITPGTIFEEDLLTESAANFVAAVAEKKGKTGAAFLDISTGSFEAWPVKSERLYEVVLSKRPNEVVVPDDGYELPETGLTGVTVTTFPSRHFDPSTAARLLEEHFRVANLDGFGLADSPAAVAAAGALLAYAGEVQRGSLDHVETLEVRRTGDRMFLDPETIRHLELVDKTTGTGPTGGTLFEILNRTKTPMGSRLLRSFLLEPLINVGEIDARLSAVAELQRNGETRAAVQSILSGVRDMERLVGRVALGTANPRDMAALGRAAGRINPLRETLEGKTAALLNVIAENLVDVSDIAEWISKALAENPPVSISEGGLIRDGYDEGLDEFRTTSREAKNFIAGLQATERERTGIGSLKVGYNKVFGYYIEVSKPNLDKVPPEYIRKQTLVNAERFITPELKEYESIALSADERQAALEERLFRELREKTAGEINRLKRAARAAALLDALQALATAAIENDFVRPELTDEKVLEVKDGRHPVVEKYYLAEPFVPNDLHLGRDETFILLTGPNMAGKSTYLRQNALIVLMAQAGSFVPAREARVGVADRIFTRIGAADDLARGRSTFLVEMSETANILRNATERSLILLDEVGRGTSTYDGVSLAWAVSEYIAKNIGARTLFATHYHELAALAEAEIGIVNYTVRATEHSGTVKFLRKVTRGVSDRSYGIQVARLAGLPPDVVAQARRILADFEGGVMPAPERHEDQVALFAGRTPILEEFLARVNPDEITPLEALELLFKLKGLAERDQ